jgi:hypothetical protein
MLRLMKVQNPTEMASYQLKRLLMEMGTNAALMVQGGVSGRGDLANR